MTNQWAQQIRQKAQGSTDCPFWMAVADEIERLRAKCDALQVELDHTVASHARGADEPSASTDWKTMREHELRYLEEVLVRIRGQYGEPATETATDALAWLRNRLTAGAEKSP